MDDASMLDEDNDEEDEDEDEDEVVGVKVQSRPKASNGRTFSGMSNALDSLHVQCAY